MLEKNSDSSVDTVLKGWGVLSFVLEFFVQKIGGCYL